MAFTPATLYGPYTFSEGGLGMSYWRYETLDAVGDIDAVDYFAGMAAPAVGNRGMEVGDIILARIWTTAIPTTTAGKAAATIADMANFVVISVDADGNASTATESAIVVAAPT